jgi:hypothetical protein
MMQSLLHMPSSWTGAGGSSSSGHRKTTVVKSSLSPPASCVLLPGVDRKQLAEKSQKLEAAAAAAHKAAQELNKQGRYEVYMSGTLVMCRFLAFIDTGSPPSSRFPRHRGGCSWKVQWALWQCAQC